MMSSPDNFFEANKTSWNKRTIVHKESSFYDLAAFKKGQSALNEIELKALGDVKGKSMLHLQCHFGMDTLSWAREGAMVTGVDLSDEAILLANEINHELKLGATFICSNIYDLPAVEVDGFSGKKNASRFDIVFTSYGTIGWLPDLDPWAKIIAHFLKPGGTFYMVDFHPTLWMMDEKFQHIKYDYFNTSVIAEENNGTYTDRNAPIKSMEYTWNHPFSEIVGALLNNGLSIIEMKEFPYSPYNCFNNLEQGTDKMWRIKDMNEKMPMLYSIKTVKQV
jgi:SAM-dependent methyltransferase